MGVIETKTFKSGNSVAVRLPKELGLDADLPVRIERVGNRIQIVPITDPADEKRRLEEMLSRIQDIWAGCDQREIGRREPVDIPERDGL